MINRLLSKIAFFAPGATTVRPWLHKRRGVKISKGVFIGQYVHIDENHPENVIIKENVVIGLRTTIITHFYKGKYRSGKKVGKITIEKNAFVGPHCVIFHDVKIGEGSVIAAGSVVSKNVPAGVLYGPPPTGPIATITRPLAKEENIDYENFLFGLRKI